MTKSIYTHLAKVTLVSVVVLSFGTGCASGSLSSGNQIELNVGSEETISEDAFKNALRSTENEYDDFEEETRYAVTNGPGFEDSFVLDFVVYAPDKGNAYGLLTVNYFAKDWIFFETLEARADGATYTLLEAASYDKYTNVEDGGYVTEVAVEQVQDSQVDAIRAVLRDPSAKLRLSGSNGNIERRITEEERRALEVMLDVHLGFQQGFTP